MEEVEATLSVEQLLGIRDLVKKCMAQAMVEDVHWGSVSGFDKPCLFQPGAQMLASLFKLCPAYEAQLRTFKDGHREHEVTCTLKGVRGEWQGLGICSTMESTYRWRNEFQEFTVTEDPVPKTYWEIKERDGAQEAKDWLKQTYPEGFPKKIDVKGWMICEGGHMAQVENPNIANEWNTILKMAKKRAFVDAVITATGCADLFTQDLDDMAQNEALPEPPKPSKKSGGAQAASSLPPATSSPKPKKSDVKPEAFPEGWRRVRVCVGGSKSTVGGKLLGELNHAQVKMVGRLLEKSVNLTDEQRELEAAVKQALEEHEAGTAEQSAASASQQTSQLDEIRKRLKSLKIAQRALMDVAIFHKWARAGDKLKDLSVDTMREILGNWDNVIGMVRENLKAKFE